MNTRGQDGKETVLIVDFDNARVGQLTAAIKNSFNVFSVQEGGSVIQELEKADKNIDVILLHMEMPDMFAMDFLRKITHNFPKVKVIAYTNEDDINICIESHEAGAFDYFHEPFQLEMLPITIERAISESEAFIKALEDRKLIDNNTADRALTIARDIMAKRRIQGRAITSRELFCLLPHPDQDTDENWYDEFATNVEEVKHAAFSEEKPNVLIVEDNESVISGFEVLLEDNFTLYTATNTQDAIRICKETKEKGINIEIILLDIFLPETAKKQEVKSTGVQLMPELLKLQTAAEVIVITAYKISEIASQVYRNGAATYLNKPVTRPKLYKAISMALQRYYYKEFQRELDYTDRQLSFRQKFRLFREFFDQCVCSGESVTMCHVFMFFPELARSGVSEKEVLPVTIGSEAVIDWLVDRLA